MTHRFFISADQLPDITGSDVHHLRTVLRLKPGAQLELLDGQGNIYLAEILELNKEKVHCKIITTRRDDHEPQVVVTLAQALPKSSKMDFVVEKCTELGATRLIPMLTERTIARTPKTARWAKIAQAAAKQSGRSLIPAISAPLSFDDVLKTRSEYDLALIPWELEKDNHLKAVLHSFKATATPSPRVLMMIGPEGGFSQKEIELALAAGFTPVSLGRRILRTETAGMAVLSIIVHELG